MRSNYMVYSVWYIMCLQELNGCFYKLDVLQKRFLATSRGLGLIEDRFSADPYENYMAVSVNWGGPQGVLMIGSLLLGVYIRAPDLWKLSFFERLATDFPEHPKWNGSLNGLKTCPHVFVGGPYM